ncbi:MAG: DNA cytosine methyltransferase [Treponema sp.]
MRYLSVCSGIEAVSAAWKSLGFTPVGFAEVEPFPCAVLQAHFPNVKNYGDITKYDEWDEIGAVDIVVGGTPCQSFSIAGKRGGLCDERGQLMYSYLGIVEKYKPRWILWENVPGVLSSGGGADFSELLSGLEKCGYGWAYRVLDAQYFGIPQRRRRVFVVGHINNRTDLAAKVLFEPESVSRNIAPSGKTKQVFAVKAKRSIGYTSVFTESSFGGYRKGFGMLRASGGAIGGGSEMLITQNNTVRKLTPLECERLQGFPDGWTRIAYRGKSADKCPDSLRYKAIGNSMAVPVMRWIGERIKRIETW